MTSYKQEPGPAGPTGPAGPAIGVSGRHYSYIQAGGTAGYTTPNVAVYRFTTGFSLRALVKPDSLTPSAAQVVAGMWAASPHRAYQLQITNANNKPQLSVSTTGSNALSYAYGKTLTQIGWPTGHAAWVRVDWVSDNGGGLSAATFYWKMPQDAAWTLLGTVTNATPGPANADTTAAVWIGSNADATNPYAGRVYVAEFYDATATLASRFDARNLANNTDNYTDLISSVTWTHQANTQVFQDDINTQDVIDGGLEASGLNGSGQAGALFGTDKNGRGRVFVPTEFNLARRGAALDGVTDDSGIWSAAITSGLPIVHPGGVSLCNPDVISSATQGVVIRGEGYHYATGAAQRQSQGSIIKANAAGTNLVALSGSECFIDGIGLEGAGLCTGDVLQIAGTHAHLDHVGCTGPSATGNAMHTTSSGDEISVGELFFSGNRLAGTTGLKVEGADGIWTLIHALYADVNMLLLAGGNEFGQVHMSQDATQAAWTKGNHVIIGCPKVFFNTLQLDNGMGASIYIDPSILSATIYLIRIRMLHVNAAATGATPDNTKPCILVNSGAGFNIKGCSITGSGRAANASNRFTYFLDPGADTSKMPGWTVDVDYMNPNAADSTNPVFKGGWRPALYRGAFSIDASTNTWQTL